MKWNMEKELIYIVAIERGINASLDEGCGYSILIVNGSAKQAKSILEQNGFKN